MSLAGDVLLLVVLLAASGAVAGVIAGLLGVGGGIVLVPAFLFIFTQLGYAGPDLMQVCLATSLATIVVTSVRSISKHRAKGAVEVEILKTWAPGIATGAILGVLVANALSSEPLKTLFGALVLLVGLWITFGRSDWRIGDEMPRGAGRAAMSGAVGFLSVLMGIGGGSFGVPLMTLHGVPVHRAVGTAAGFGLLIAVPSVIGFLLSPAAGAPPFTVGSVNLVAFAIVVAMTWLTAPLGVTLAHRLDARVLRRGFGVFLLAVALRILWLQLG